MEVIFGDYILHNKNNEEEIADAGTDKSSPSARPKRVETMCYRTNWEVEQGRKAGCLAFFEEIVDQLSTKSKMRKLEKNIFFGVKQKGCGFLLRFPINNAKLILSKWANEYADLIKETRAKQKKISTKHFWILV